jgi:hypothetical protein
MVYLNMAKSNAVFKKKNAVATGRHVVNLNLCLALAVFSMTTQ